MNLLQASRISEQRGREVSVGVLTFSLLMITIAFAESGCSQGQTPRCVTDQDCGNGYLCHRNECYLKCGQDSD